MADGWPAFLGGTVQGLPLKLYVHAASLRGLPLADVLLGVALNRIERMLVLGLVMAVVGVMARPIIVRWPRAVALIYESGWLVFYSLFWASRAT